MRLSHPPVQLRAVKGISVELRYNDCTTFQPHFQRDIRMAGSSAAPFRTNPSTIARYFFHDCERFLYYSSADPAQRRRESRYCRETCGV